jgi:membrane-associated phospholipid phosphatase
MNEATNDIKKRNRWFKLLTAEFLIILLLLVAITVFALAVNMVFIRKTTHFDDAVFTAVGEYVTEARTRFFLFITFFGNHKFLIPANLVLLAYYIFKKNNRLSVRVIALALSSLTLKFLLKFFFQRPRPSIPLVHKVQGYSFPSGHALIGVAFYGLMIYITWRTVKNRWLRGILIAGLILLIALISFSRIYLRVHYASDVIAGICVGFIWLMLSLWAIARVEKKRFARQALANTVPPVN